MWNDDEWSGIFEAFWYRFSIFASKLAKNHPGCQACSSMDIGSPSCGLRVPQAVPWWPWWIPEICPLENHWKSIKPMAFLMCNLAMLFFIVFPSTFSMQVHQVQKQRSQVYWGKWMICNSGGHKILQLIWPDSLNIHWESVEIYCNLDRFSKFPKCFLHIAPLIRKSYTLLSNAESFP